jgi:hypothetical protein
MDSPSKYVMGYENISPRKELSLVNQLLEVIHP